MSNLTLEAKQLYKEAKANKEFRNFWRSQGTPMPGIFAPSEIKGLVSTEYFFWKKDKAEEVARK